jgi:hypothetical protein
MKQFHYYSPLARLIFLFLGLSLASCATKVNADGTVFSKHNFPVEGAVISFQYSVGGKNEIQGDVRTTTGKDGKFAISTTTGKRNCSIDQIIITHDSGRVALMRNQFNLGSNMVITLQ